MLIIAKTNFRSLISQMLGSISLKLYLVWTNSKVWIKDFHKKINSHKQLFQICFLKQVARSVILLNIFSCKHFRPQILLTTFRTYLKDFVRAPLNFRLYVSLQTDKTWTLSKDFGRKFTRQLSRTHIFITKKPFSWKLLSCRL